MADWESDAEQNFNDSWIDGTTQFVNISSIDIDSPIFIVELKSFVVARAGAASYNPFFSGRSDPFNGSAQISSWADPAFFIDPAWANADLFEVVVSPGINNTVVPIPPAFWLFGSGLLG